MGMYSCLYVKYQNLMSILILPVVWKKFITKRVVRHLLTYHQCVNQRPRSSLGSRVRCDKDP